MDEDGRATPPEELDESIRDLLDELASQEPEQLRAVATYAGALAAQAETDAETAVQPNSETGNDDTDRDESATDPADPGSEYPDPDAYPADVPEHASVSVTEIAGTEYWYYQWREGDEIRSKTLER